MKTYLVTGGAGFIGSNYIRYMLNKYKGAVQIINVDSLTYAGNLENLNSVEKNNNYRFIKADITDSPAIDEIFSKNQIDYVIHFAAETHVDRSIKTPDVFVQTNILGTLTLLNTAKKYWGENASGKKYVQVSTDEVYGSLGEHGYFTESTPLDPHSPYAVSKASGDMLVKSYFDTYNMPVNITRCSNNYGPYQFPEKLIPLMINNILNGKPLPVYGDGKNVRDWLYVEDHAKAIDAVTQNGRLGEVYNIGGHNEKQNIEIVNIIIETIRDFLEDGDPRKAHATTDLIQYVQDRKGHDKRYAIDPQKISGELNWQPETMFADGIKKTIAWYLNNHKWVENVVSGEYQTYYEDMYKADKNL